MTAAPAAAQQSPALAAVLHDALGGRTPRPGKVRLRIPTVAENGNSVPMTVSVEGGDKVRRIVVVATGNPFPLVGEYRFGPRAARPEVQTRIRLAKTQTVMAVAELQDGSLWSDTAEMTVTLGACAELMGE